MLRLKSSKLIYENERWYYQNQLFSGVIFFDKTDFFVEPFIVIAGRIDSPYRSICIPDFLSEVSQIDCTNFWIEYYDEHGAGLPQYYPNHPDETQPWHNNNGVPYEGMSYVFEEGICTFEAFSDKDGYYAKRISYNKNGDILDFEFYTLVADTYLNHFGDKNFPEISQTIFYRANRSFLYQNQLLKNDNHAEWESISIKFGEIGIESFYVIGDVLENKSYLKFPFYLPKIFDILQDYSNLIMDKYVGLELRCPGGKQLLEHWANHQAFKNTESIYFADMQHLGDFQVLNNPQLFPKLKKVTLSLCSKDDYKNKAYDTTISHYQTLENQINLVNELKVNSHLDIQYYYSRMISESTVCLILDVFYFEKDNQTFANVAGIRFRGGKDFEIYSEHTMIVENVAPYESGQFYKREMPCLLALIEKINQTKLPYQVIIIDGFVHLADDKAGLGKHLYDNLSDKKPIIGIAKNPFYGIDDSHAVYRGTSKHPLYVTTQDFELPIAKDWVKNLQGHFRLPDIVNQVDKLSRQF